MAERRTTKKTTSTVIGAPDEKIQKVVAASGNVTTNTEDALGNEFPFTDFTVPENCIFAMGDNRAHSTDCREFGCIPLEKIESKVWIRFWPLNQFGKIDK